MAGEPLFRANAYLRKAPGRIRLICSPVVARMWREPVKLAR